MAPEDSAWQAMPHFCEIRCTYSCEVLGTVKESFLRPALGGNCLCVEEHHAVNTAYYCYSPPGS